MGSGEAVKVKQKANTVPLLRTTWSSPVGDLTIVTNSEAVRAILWPDERVGRVTIREPISDGLNEIGDQVITELDEYFAGDRTRFTVPVSIVGTDFQRSVWKALTGLTFGTTASYRDLAAVVGNPGAARAVGAATGLNPVSIVVPCHRLIGSNGAMTGFAGGLEAKRWLLAHEQNVLADMRL